MTYYIKIIELMKNGFSEASLCWVSNGFYVGYTDSDPPVNNRISKEYGRSVVS